MTEQNLDCELVFDARDEIASNVQYIRDHLDECLIPHEMEASITGCRVRRQGAPFIGDSMDTVEPFTRMAHVLSHPVEKMSVVGPRAPSPI